MNEEIIVHHVKTVEDLRQILRRHSLRRDDFQRGDWRGSECRRARRWHRGQMEVHIIVPVS